MKIFTVLDSIQISELKKEISQCSWKDGKLSAEGGAKSIKRNSEINSADPNFKNILKKIINVLEKSNVKAYTYMRDLINPMVSKYSNGDFYDWHVDVALLANRRTDLSFTLFLNDYSDYSGGELEIEVNNQKYQIKGKAGDIIIYPSGLKHRVNNITNGERLVIVG